MRPVYSPDRDPRFFSVTMQVPIQDTDADGVAGEDREGIDHAAREAAESWAADAERSVESITFRRHFVQHDYSDRSDKHNYTYHVVLAPTTYEEIVDLPISDLRSREHLTSVGYVPLNIRTETPRLVVFVRHADGRLLFAEQSLTLFPDPPPATEVVIRVCDLQETSWWHLSQEAKARSRPGLGFNERAMMLWLADMKERADRAIDTANG